MSETQNKMFESLATALQPYTLKQEQLRTLVETACANMPKLDWNPYTPAWMDEVKKLQTPMTAMAARIDEITAPMKNMQTLLPAAEVLKGVIENVHFDIRLQDIIAEWNEQQKTVIESLHTEPNLLDEGEAALLSHAEDVQKWGLFGWTLSMEASITQYYRVPASKEEADRIMADVYDQQSAEATMDELQKCTYHKAGDIKEAIDCYHAGHYKSCALLLFSMIDSLLIHTQDNSKYADNRKQGGTKAIGRFKELKDPDESIDKSFKMLSFVMVVDALNEFFADTTNFADDRIVLNRHLLCHGMLGRSVTKIDCDQLFLLYDNMLYCTDALIS